jgi:glycosyltransferase involved in cell wall biosynthesis
MKILYLCPDYGIPVLGHKGASVHVREMVAAMQRAGHQVVLVAPVATKSAWEEPAAVAANFLHIPASDEQLACITAVDGYANSLQTRSELARDLRRILYDRHLEAKLLRKFVKSPPDLIYVRASLHSTAAIALARATRRPLLVELNAPLAEEHATYRAGSTNELAAAAERALLQAADGVLVVSRVLAEHAVQCGVARERIHVIPNAIDPALFHPAPRSPQMREQLQVGEGPVLGFVGGLRQWHGVDILPDLIARLVPDFPGVKMVIVGNGPLQEPLQQRLESMGYHDRAIFTGSLQHAMVAQVIREFDVSLAPYPQLDHRFYFSPLKLFEYMACGTAVVSANVGQISEVLCHEKTGLLYPPGDLAQLTTCCQRLLFDPSLQESLGSAAAATVKQHYTWDGNAQRVTEIAALAA